MRISTLLTLACIGSPFSMAYVPTPSFHSKKKDLFPTTVTSMYPYSIQDEPFFMNDWKVSVHNKIKSGMQLIRYENLLPTFLLNVCGGWITNPSLYHLLHSSPFKASIVITLLIMSSSMVINDIVDVPIDRINNPNKPLVRGSITRMEAFFYLIVMLSIAEGLSIHFLTLPMQKIIHGVISIILLYTPILKKIPLLKNITCASLVSFSVLFSAMASSHATIRNRELLMVLATTLFYGSFHNEVLLDICDKEGDQQSGIYTLPVLFGNVFSIRLLSYLTHILVLGNTILLANHYSQFVTFLYPLFFVKPYLHLLHMIYIDDSPSYVWKVVRNTNIVLFGLLLYACALVR